jgi:stage II sporulation protein R
MFNPPYPGNTIAITYSQIPKQPVRQADRSFMKNFILDNVLALHKSTSRFTYFYRCMFYFCLSLSVSSLLLLNAFPSNAKEEHLQEGIASDVIRFHVIANSDSEKDQALKLEIKQALTEELRPKLENVKDIDKARTILKNNLEEMVLTANRIIKENGFDYTARASLEQGYFPLKVYGDLSLPPGQYEAVKVALGAAAGQNWWCVMFPPLCFVDATYSVVPDSSKAELKYLLTDEEYKAVFQKDTKVKVKFKLFSLIKDALKD